MNEERTQVTLVEWRGPVAVCTACLYASEATDRVGDGEGGTMMV